MALDDAERAAPGEHAPDGSPHAPDASPPVLGDSPHALDASPPAPDALPPALGDSRHAPDDSRHAPDDSRHAPDDSRHAPDAERGANDAGGEAHDREHHGEQRRGLAVLLDQRLILLGLLLLATGYTLYAARPVLLPIAVAVLLKLLLNPPVRWLGRRGVPEPAGAALVLLAFLALLGFAASQLLAPAMAWIDALPAHLERLERRIDELRQPVGALQEAAERVQEAATGKADGGGAQTPPVPVEVRKGPLSNVFVIETTATLAGAIVVLMLTWFLLAVGDVFLRKLTKVIPRFADKRRAVAMAHEVETELSRYLATVRLINGGLAVAVATVMSVWGMPDAILLGILAGVANFVPYLGPVAVFLFTCLLSFVTYDSLGMAVLPPLSLATLNFAEGFLITPTVLGRRFAINPVVIFVWLLFWGWLWGVLGAFLAVPLLTGLKVVCQKYPPLHPIGELLAPRDAPVEAAVAASPKP